MTLVQTHDSGIWSEHPSHYTTDVEYTELTFKLNTEHMFSYLLDKNKIVITIFSSSNIRVL